MFKIREYKTGDAEKIYTLFSKYTSYKRDAAFWVWINRLLSEKKSIISVAEANNQIIGHYAIIPRNCIINKKTYRTGLGIHAFVDPEYRDSISIFDITSHAYRFAKENEIDFIYGFPNQNYRLVQEKIEKWKKVALFNAFEKDANNFDPAGPIFKWELFNLKDFDKIFILNELAEEFGNSNDIYFSKPLPFIVNRYLYHPQNIYQTWLLKDIDKYVGFIVTKIFNSENEKRAHIIDYVLSPEYETDTLIADFEIKFSLVVDKFVLWPFSNKFHKSLLKRNFSESGFETFFGIKFLSESAKKATDDILNFNNWHLTMGDSDAF
jgi:hypothetical protein